jgi:hypothetical protein
VITPEQYFAAKPHSPQDEERAAELLDRVEKLCTALAWDWPICPNTGSSVSGSKGGSGDGGFRLQTATTGAATSSHKEARAVDVYDPENELDELITDALLTAYGLYREAPEATPGWSHLTTRAPKSGRRTFVP